MLHTTLAIAAFFTSWTLLYPLSSHCRLCGFVFCADCSKYRALYRGYELRACSNCWHQFLQERAPSMVTATELVKSDQGRADDVRRDGLCTFAELSYTGAGPASQLGGSAIDWDAIMREADETPPPPPGNLEEKASPGLDTDQAALAETTTAAVSHEDHTLDRALSMSFRLAPLPQAEGPKVDVGPILYCHLMSNDEYEKYLRTGTTRHRHGVSLPLIRSTCPSLV